MRFTLLLIFCTIGFTASAQFWRRKPKPAPVVLTAVQSFPTQVTNTTIDVSPKNLHGVELPCSVYNLELAEEAILKEAKHNMRFRIYNLASYNFSDLAALYLKQNRFSEAKWYLLQSNTIARQAEDSRHLLNNLLVLAAIKNRIGEIPLALVDLQEAHDIAFAKGMLTDLAAIDKQIKYLQTNKILTAKAELRYAEAVETAAAANNKAVVN
ncbi:hypothetical protein [Mucilaginibacter sp. UR6-11]|uniref:hypothetical protein n=1 Tax=Mucilaginibacter sp. UR6-11 TaxID=1435644 RepID=UPI001E555E8D|nr:hypothetical protein [Mucilaginibacter sp. UR6-11]MCC8424961.1 hypothetical protein [Mucilaginibacter sp. UR6-11]